MGVHYDANQDRHWPYPDTTDLLKDYDSHVGDEVFLFLTIERVDPETNTVTSRITHEDGELLLVVEGVSADVRPDGVIQVVGVVRPNNVIEAETVRVVNARRSSSYYKYAVSIAGAVLCLTLFFRRWKIDTSSLAFEPR